jgi:hypothetical protein
MIDPLEDRRSVKIVPRGRAGLLRGSENRNQNGGLQRPSTGLGRQKKFAFEVTIRLDFH